MKFGAFVQIAEGVEGLVHVSEISADKRINHPQDVLRAGQVVKAQVLAIAPEKRQIKLSMKQLVPTSIDEYIAEHKPGDVVSGRVVDESPGGATVELGEGIRATCRVAKSATGDCAREQARWQSRSVFALFDAAVPLEGKYARSIGRARAAACRPDPQLQDREARSRLQDD